MKLVRKQEFFINGIEFKCGPKAVEQLLRVSIDALDKGLTGVKEIVQGGMAMQLGDLLAHPFPESLNGIEVRTVAGQGPQEEAQVGGRGLDELGFVPRGSIPDNEYGLGKRAQPRRQLVQEFDRIRLVTGAFVPKKTLPLREIIGTIPINPLRQRGAVTQAPGGLTGCSPGVAQVQITMEVCFVDVNEPEFGLTNLLEQGLKFGNESGALVGLGFLEHFLALFPTQPLLLEEGVQCTPAHRAAKDLLDPAAHFP